MPTPERRAGLVGRRREAKPATASAVCPRSRAARGFVKFNSETARKSRRCVPSQPASSRTSKRSRSVEEPAKSLARPADSQRSRTLQDRPRSGSSPTACAAAACSAARRETYAGESPRLIFALEAGVAHDLDQAAHHLRAPLHSVVANFQITAKTPRGSTSFEVARVIDDYPRTIEVPAARQLRAHELRVEPSACSCSATTACTRACGSSPRRAHAEACTLAALRAPLRGNNKPAERKPSDDRVAPAAVAETARLVVHARGGGGTAAPRRPRRRVLRHRARPSGGDAWRRRPTTRAARSTRGDGSYAVIKIAAAGGENKAREAARRGGAEEDARGRSSPRGRSTSLKRRAPATEEDTRAPACRRRS